MEAQGRPLPGYVQNEFDAFLQCGRLEHGFLRLRCEDCKHEHLIAFSCKRRGFCPSCGARRMAESAALLVDDVFPREPIRQWVLSFPFQLRFLFASYPELMGKVLGIVYRTLATHIIHKAGFTNSTAHTGAVTLIQRFGSALTKLYGHSITYRIAIGPHQGRKVFTLQSLPPIEDPKAGSSRVANVAGFSLHAGVMAEAYQRDKLERLCRYIARPAVSEKHLSLLDDGRICYELKMPYRDGTTHVIFEPLDFLARLAALVPKPRVNLTRFHGVFAPNSKHRIKITPAKRGKGRKRCSDEQGQSSSSTERRAAMTWAQRLKRVFNIDIETGSQCGGAVSVIAGIEDPVVIDKILSHLEKKAILVEPVVLPQSRAPPQSDLFDGFSVNFASRNCSHCGRGKVPVLLAPLKSVFSLEKTATAS